ncbi:hypothetical protein D5282_00250 [bacterium 1xD8-48]|nr:hypothetical protein [bacterium 1xD8-48]
MTLRPFPAVSKVGYSIAKRGEGVQGERKKDAQRKGDILPLCWLWLAVLLNYCNYLYTYPIRRFVKCFLQWSGWRTRIVFDN